MASTTLAAAAEIYRKLLELNGLDVASLYREVGFKLDPSGDPNARTSIKEHDALLSLAAALIPDEAWALKAAHCWHPGNLGVLGHAWLASSTLRTGLKRLVRYWRILGERAVTRIDETGDRLRFTYTIVVDDPALQAVMADSVLSILMAMCRSNAGETIRPLKVTLRRKRPVNPEAWTDFFGCEVEFEAPENSLTLSNAVADRLLPTANRQLAGVFDHLLTDQLAQLSKDDVVSRCKAAFLDQLTSGEPLEEEIAGRLHVSRRTLQRKLAEAETTYVRLVDDTRRELALRYIDDRAKSISDITFLLGFSGQSAFSRAFKRWTGRSPTEHRSRAATPSQS